MLQYIYKPSEVGLKDWPAGTLRLEGMEVTEDPRAADVFVYPGALHEIGSGAELDRLPYFKGNEERHVFFHCSDHEVLYHKRSLFIRCNLRPWNLEADPCSIPWPWPVEDYSECMRLPEGGFKYDISFQGWLWSRTRKESFQACLQSSLKCDFAGYDDFAGYLHDRKTGQWTEEGLRRRAEFRRSMRESRLALCPEQIPGVLPYRFFEAMSAGRVPVLVGADYVLPFADEIPYSRFCLQFRSTEIGIMVRQIRTFLQMHSDPDLLSMGRDARGYWEKWLDSNKWPSLMTYAVEQRLAPPGRCA